MGVLDYALEAVIRSKLQDHGATAGEAYKASKDPWVQQVARDRLAGKPTPQGMADADINKIRATAKADGVSIVDVFKRDYADIPYPGQAAKELPGRLQSAGVAAASLPPRAGAATPQANPVASAAQQPAPTPAAPTPQPGPTNFGWMLPGHNVPNERSLASWAAPTPQTMYRQPYALSAQDISPHALDVIAREANPGDVRGIDAVIDTALNRIGGQGFRGPNATLYDVLTAPGKQFEAHSKLQSGSFKPATEEQRAQVLERLNAKASGTEPDITNGATAYRAGSYVRGEGKGKTFDLQSQGGANIGDNVFIQLPGTKVGPHGPGTGYTDALSKSEAPPPLPEGGGILNPQALEPSTQSLELGAKVGPGAVPPVAPPPAAPAAPAAAAPAAPPPAPQAPPLPDRPPDVMFTPAAPPPWVSGTGQAAAKLPPAPPFAPPPLPGRNPNIPTYEASQGRTGVGSARAKPLPPVSASGTTGGAAPKRGVTGTAKFAPPPLSVTGAIGATRPQGVTGAARIPTGRIDTYGGQAAGRMAAAEGRAALGNVSARANVFGRPVPLGAQANVDMTQVPIPGRNPARDVHPVVGGTTGGPLTPRGISGAAQFNPPLPSRNPNMPTYGASQGRTGLGSAGQQFAPPPMPVRRPVTASGSVGMAAPPGGLAGVANARQPFPVPTYGASSGRTGMGSAQASIHMPPAAPPPMQIPVAVAPPPPMPTYGASQGRTGVGGVFPGGVSSFQKNVFPNVTTQPKNAITGVTSFPRNTPFAPTYGASQGRTGIRAAVAPPPVTPGFNFINPASTMPPALPGGLGMNPLTAAALSRGVQSVQASPSMGRGTFPSISGTAMFPQAAAALRPPTIGTPPSIAARPPIGAPIGGPAQMGRGMTAPSNEGTNILGSTFGGGHAPGSGFSPFSGSAPPMTAYGGTMSKNTAQLHSIADSYAAGAAALHGSAQRVESGFRANRAINFARSQQAANFWNGRQALIRRPMSTGYGYL